MSLDRSTESLNSPSKDSFGSFTSYSWSRSNTVRKVNSIGSSTPCTVKEQGAVKRLSVDDLEVTTDRILDNLNVEHGGRDKLRKCLTDIAYRQSLDSISEYKAKTSFSSQRPPSRECSSFESSASSDCTECALQTGTGDSNLKGTTLSENSSCYLSWIESLNSEYLSNASITDVASVDGKAGEWNNFWLNYNNARNRYSQQNSFSCSMSTSDNTADDFIDSKIADNIQKEQFSENPSDLFYMTRSEILETIKCCQKIIEVLQSALSKTADNTRNNSNYIMSKRTSTATEVSMDSHRYSVGNFQKQKYNTPPKQNFQSTGSCINAFFGTGVTDILRRVIAKRRDSTESQGEPSISKNIFPNWATGNLR